MNPPKMPIHIGDYKRDTGHLRAVGHGAYLLLLFHHWSTGELPTDDDQLSAIACMTKQEWAKAKPVLAKFFGPGWVHGRVIADLAESQESYEKLSKAGKAGAEAKAKKKRRLSDATSDATSIATSGAEPTNNLPLTFNQSKKDAASAAPDPEVELFRRGKEVLGKTAGGLVKQLLDAKGGKINLARAAIETAAGKENPREYVGKIISNQTPQPGEVSRFVDGRL